MADVDDPPPPIEHLQAESALAKKIQEGIRQKLTTDYAASGTEETLQTVLPEYIKVLVCNGKPRSAVVEDLGLFLQDKAGSFVDWLWKMLAELNPERTQSAFPSGDGQMDQDDAEKPATAPEPTKKRSGRLRRMLEGDRKRTRSRAADAMQSSKGFRDAIQTVAEETRPAAPARRRLRARDPERAAKLRSEWEEMKAREERNQADRDLLATPVAQENTKFTITMNKVGPQDIPSIAHYDDHGLPSASRALPLLMGVPPVAPAHGPDPQTLRLAQQLEAILAGGSTGGPPAVDDWAPPFASFGKGKGGKGYYKGGKPSGFSGPSPHMVFVRGAGGGGERDEVPAAKRPRVMAPPAGKGSFRHMVWQPGMKSDASNAPRGGHKVWVNPASKAGAAAPDTETAATVEEKS